MGGLRRERWKTRAKARVERMGVTTQSRAPCARETRHQGGPSHHQLFIGCSAVGARSGSTSIAWTWGPPGSRKHMRSPDGSVGNVPSEPTQASGTTVLPVLTFSLALPSREGTWGSGSGRGSKGPNRDARGGAGVLFINTREGARAQNRDARGGTEVWFINTRGGLPGPPLTPPGPAGWVVQSQPVPMAPAS